MTVIPRFYSANDHSVGTVEPCRNDRQCKLTIIKIIFKFSIWFDISQPKFHLIESVINQMCCCHQIENLQINLQNHHAKNSAEILIVLISSLLN